MFFSYDLKTNHAVIESSITKIIFVFSITQEHEFQYLFRKITYQKHQLSLQHYSVCFVLLAVLYILLLYHQLLVFL